MSYSCMCLVGGTQQNIRSLSVEQVVPSRLNHSIKNLGRWERVNEGIRWGTDWASRWDEGRIQWHSPDVNKFLVSYFAKVTGKEVPSSPLDPSSEEFQNNSKKKWFVPLCGKTVEIPFLLSLGYRVFGVEGVRKPIEALNAENNMNLRFDEERSVFEGAEGRLQIYYGDLFTCPVENFGPFDFCWDRASLIAVEYSQRLSYKKMLQKAMLGYPFSYLLEVITYDKERFAGPPRSVDNEDITTLYGDWTEVEMLFESENLKVNPEVMPNFEPGEVSRRVFFLTPKKSTI